MIVRQLFAMLGLQVDASGFDKGEAAISKVKSGLVGLVAVAGAAAAGITQAVRSTAEAGNEVAVAARRLGVTTDAIQELRFAAEESGLSTETLDHGLNHLARTLLEAKNGSSEATLTLQKLGLKAHDALLPADQVLLKVAAKVSAMPDGLQKAGLAAQAFGREGGTHFIPFLNRGAEGIQALMGRAQAYGDVLSGEVIRASQEFVAAQRDVTLSLKGLGYALGGPLIAEFTPLLLALGQWIRLNRETIASGVIDFARGFGSALGLAASLAGGLFRILKPFLLVLLAIASNARVLKLLVTGLALALGVYLAGAIGTSIVGLGIWITETWAAAAAMNGFELALAAGGVTMALAPYAIGAAWLALLGIVLLVIDDIATYIRGGKSVTGEWADALRPAWDRFVTYVENDFTRFCAWLVQTAVEAAGKMGDALKDAAKDNPIVGGLLDAASSASDTARGGLDKLEDALGFGPEPAAYAVAGRFGGGASPQASAAAAQGFAPGGPAVQVDASINGGIHVHTQNHVDEHQVADLVGKKIDEHHARTMRETHAAVKR